MIRFSPPRSGLGAVALLLAALALPSCRGATSSEPAPDGPRDTVHVVTFGDSNTDMAMSPVAPYVRARSYVSDGGTRPDAREANNPAQLAGLVEARWHALRATPIRVANHGISGTTTGGGGHGGPERNPNGAPHARTAVNGVTRFEGEVMGRALPWSGGEPRGGPYAQGPIRRVNAFVPGPYDFAYVSMGTNDQINGISPAQTLQNLEWMVQQWIAAGHPPDHLVLTTLAPRLDLSQGVGEAIVAINPGIRELAQRTGVGVIDLSAYTSPSDGRSWRDPAMHIGDAVHYTTAVRDWIAQQLVAYIAERVPADLP